MRALVNLNKIDQNLVRITRRGNTLSFANIIILVLYSIFTMFILYIDSSSTDTNFEELYLLLMIVETLLFSLLLWLMLSSLRKEFRRSFYIELTIKRMLHFFLLIISPILLYGLLYLVTLSLSAPSTLATIHMIPLEAAVMFNLVNENFKARTTRVCHISFS